MLKQILTYSMALLVVCTTYGQIGIGTSKPDLSSVLDISSTESGLLIPRLTTAERDAILSPAFGLMIYNRDNGCIELNYGTTTDVKWACAGGVGASSVIQDCTINGFQGNYVNGVTFTASNTFSVTITNNSFNTVNISFSPSDLVLSGVGGLSVTSVNPPSATIASGGSQLVEYTLTGTPTSAGILIGVWTKLGLSCVQQVNVISGDATFNFPQTVFVASMNDGSPVVDIQGVIDNGSNQVTVNLPYTGGIGTYEAFTGNYVLNNTGTGEAGDINRFRLSYPGGTFSSSGSITATIEVDGDGSFNAKKQLFGIQETIALLNFKVNGNIKGNVNLDVVAGVPDRNFTDVNHKFIYLPVNAADGRVWLNNNLGANYANINHPSFNPLQQATAHDDYHAYGSLLQWGRFSDGHELINWTNSTTGVPVNGNTGVNSITNLPGDNLFITEVSSPNDWRVPSNDNLWQGEVGINNPCPQGYRLPTNSEMITLFSSEGINDYFTAVNSSLALSSSGNRDYSNGLVINVGIFGSYWSSTVNGILARNHNFDNTLLSSSSSFRANGLPVRCIKD